MGFQPDISKAFAVLVVAASSCAGHHSPPGSPPSAAPDSKPAPAAPSPTSSASAERPQTGIATYYARRFAGRKTASGDRYDPSLFTAAHRTLPFGTMVEVRRLDAPAPERGRRVVVRINDRGPFGDPERVINLSRRAAEELGIVQEGKVRVELRPLPATP